jgi:flagellar hook assembly protein FlgD
MKTKSIVLAGMMVLASVLTYAIDPIGSQLVVVNQKASGLVKVIYQSQGEKKVTLKVYNESGEVVFKEQISSLNGFIRPLNFSGMENGNYTIETTDDNGKQIQSIGYKTDVNMKTVHVSRVKEEGKYLLAVTNGGTEEINVRIFDGDNNLVHNKNLTINGSFGLVYNLQQIVGHPTFEITDTTGKTTTIVK